MSDGLLRCAPRSSTDEAYCVVSAGSTDRITSGDECASAKLTFALAGNNGAKVTMQRPRICVKGNKVRYSRCLEGDECPTKRDSCSLLLEVPGLADIAASTPRSAKGTGTPLYTLIEEEAPCLGFFCPDVVVELKTDFA